MMHGAGFSNRTLIHLRWSARGSVALLAMLLLLLAGCDAAGIAKTHPTASVSAFPTSGTSNGSPYSWRAAYEGEDGHLHAVTLDGRHDQTGVLIPTDRYWMPGLVFYYAGASPDGRALAYMNTIATISAGTRVSAVKFLTEESGYQFFWSPDSTRLAINYDGEGYLIVEDVATNVSHDIPGLAGHGITNLYGWIDTTHLAVRMLGKSTVSLGSLDITNGNLRVVATFSLNSIGVDSIRLSPDGKQALFYNAQFRSDPYTPMVDVIDIATGQVRALPRITQAIVHASGQSISTIAWKPGSEIAAISTGYQETNNLKLWILNLTNDTITHLTDGQHAEGWCPDGGPLVIGTGWDSVIDQGPYALSAVTFSALGKPEFTVLTKSAKTFPFLGCIS